MFGYYKIQKLIINIQFIFFDLNFHFENYIKNCVEYYYYGNILCITSIYTYIYMNIYIKCTIKCFSQIEFIKNQFGNV